MTDDAPAPASPSPNEPQPRKAAFLSGGRAGYVALGLSVVHVHRVLRTLRDDGLATLRNGVLRISDWEALSRLGGFDPERLRPQQEPFDSALDVVPKNFTDDTRPLDGHDRS